MTTFEITKLPDRCQLKILAVDVELGIQYPIADETNLKSTNATPYHGRPFDSFKYKIHKDGVESVNEGNVVLSYGLLVPAVPNVLDEIKTMNIYESFGFVSVFPQQDGVDKIQITDLDGKGSWVSDKGPLNIGDSFFYYELDSLIFLASESGLSATYNVLKFTTSYAGVANVGESSLTANVTSLGGELSLIGPLEYSEELGIETSVVGLIVDKGKSSVPCKISIDTTDFVQIGTTANIINYHIGVFGEPGTDGSIITSGVTEITTTTNEVGIVYLWLTIVKDFVTITEIAVNVNLLEIDSTPANVNLAVDEITLLIPITGAP